ncbi:MAG: threonine synthase [Betaproteobacteria bacterium]|nr:threonine synthase [Betaproteobacteria bacterium]
MNYIDAATGATYPLDQPRWCGDGGAHLNLGDAPGLTRGEIDTTKHSVWRYAKAMLVEAKDAVTLGEGWTPLVDGKLDGIAVTMKLEFMMPTGSFKDRGMTTLITYLKNRGVMSVLEDSSGNAGASMAAYSAAAGMKARILVPETASYPKIAQMAATGADVVTVKGSRQDVADAALRYAKEIFYASHNWQPFFLEGTKTLAYELWEQFGFKIPDNIVFPVGYGSNVCGCERGFAELKRRGEIDRMPRLFAVQAANCAPLYAAFKAGADKAVPTDVTTTVAEGIASSKPTRLREVVRAIKHSGGSIVAVSEEEIVSALGALARQGLYVEPTSAAAAAGLRQLFKTKAIVPEQKTVLVLTGMGLKASEKIGQLLKVGARSE